MSAESVAARAGAPTVSRRAAIAGLAGFTAIFAATLLWAKWWPAVLVFLAIRLPWERVATRVAIGALLVFTVSSWVARLAPRRESTEPAADPLARAEAHAADSSGPAALAHPVPSPPRRFGASLRRMSVRLIPEYLVAVFAIGLLRGWLFPFDGSATNWTLIAVAFAAIAGTLVVIPTAGEIPIITPLLAAGVAPSILGALLITLPAVSAVSIAMVGRALGWRVTFAMTGAVCIAGIVAGAMLWALGVPGA